MKKAVKKILGENGLDTIRRYYPLTRSKWTLLFMRRKFKHFGKKSSITWPSVFEGKNNIFIGERTDIGAFVHIWGNGGVHIGNDVLIASHVTITSLTHSYTGPTIKSSPTIAAPVSIGNGAWIGSHAVIMPGVTIGEGAVIGAGAVVTSDIPVKAVAVGVPAKIIKYR